MLKGKKILLGITGSIAAYKSASLIRLLVKDGAEVKVVITPLTKEFITPLTLSTLSGNPVYCDFFERPTGQWNSHVSLSLWADLFVIAPATANTIAKMSNGIADNLLLTTYLSARCPVFIAPAMDVDMYRHPTTQKNIETLISYGNNIIEPSVGDLASGLSGKGRMEEPEKIIDFIKKYFSNIKKKRLAGKKILVTAGPTYEPIDPVRFIGNRSSGKMGYAIANTLAEEGAEVILISGPVKIKIENPEIKLINVNTANEMYNACIKHFDNSVHAAILAAAVSDYTPSNKYNQKIKRKTDNLKIELIPTADIAAELGKIKNQNQILIGFALETNDELQNAKEKLKSKNFDFIVLNTLANEQTCFDYDTNKITIIDNKNQIFEFDFKNKNDVAFDIVNKLIETLDQKNK